MLVTMSSPVFVPVPEHVIYDPSLKPEERAVLLIISAETTRSGCRKKDPALALLIGMKVAKFKRILKSLIVSGRVSIDENPDGRLLFVNERPAEEKKEESENKTSDLFDKSNLVVPESQVSRLITIFFKSGVNPLLTGEHTRNRFYANPYNRQGAKNLIVSYGSEAAEEAIEKLAKRRGDKFMPKVRSLWTLYEKWEMVHRFLESDWRTPKEKIVTIK